jgi:hypothetical protein
MLRPGLIVILACSVVAAGCSVVAGVVGGFPKIVSVTITAPAGLLVGDSAIATAVAMGDDGRDHLGRPRHWTSSDPAALPIDANGKMVALIAGRRVTITCEVDGTTGTATVVVAGDDTRFGYALADQPTAAGPYVPAAGTLLNSGGGTIQVTRTSVGIYSVRFEGLGRQPGQHDNVQVSAYGSVFAYCKPDLWTTSGADLVVPVVCFDVNGNPEDSRFTIMASGAWAFGKSAPLAFALFQPDTAMYYRLDSAATTRNSTGGHLDVSRQSEGNFPVNLDGLGPVWAAAPAAVTVTGVGTGVRRCRLIAYDRANAGLDVLCTGLGGGPRDAPWSLLWVQHGRPSMRFGFAWANAQSSTVDYTPAADFLKNSSGGGVKARKTALGQYHVVFPGLGRPAGATETVLVSPLFNTADRICDIVLWGNVGASDLFVDVACYDAAGASVDSGFGVMVVQ